MIEDRTSGVEVQSTIDGDKIALSIAKEAMAHIMTVLTDLYSDPEAAVIREYGTNARDAHIEAGRADVPIEVTTPSPLSPFLKIRDYGVGLSVDDIHDIYSKYGASTKRATNDQTGMLGLGCKSGLTYADQFTLSSTKNGTRVQVSISRDEDGTGSMTVVDTSTTDEPDGTEIVVPARRHNTFDRKAQEFFSYWQPGTVLVNGEQPKRVDGLWISDKLLVIENGSRYAEGEHKIVMGNVAYPAEFSRNTLGLNHGYALIAFVDIGDVHFVPSRESLHMTDKTKATIERIVQEFRAKAPDAVQNAVNKAKNHRAALEVVSEWRGMLDNNLVGSRVYTYKGANVPSEIHFPVDPQTGDQERIILTPHHSHVLSRHERARQVMAHAFCKSLWLYGWDYANFTAPMKKRLRLYCEQNDLDPQYFILSKSKPDTLWLGVENVKDWSVVQAVKLPRTAPSLRTGRIPGSFDVVTGGMMKRGFPADQIDAKAPLFYFENARQTEFYSYPTRYANLLETYYSGMTLVILPANRAAKFQRDFPTAKCCHAEVKALLGNFEKKLTADQRRALSLHIAGKVQALAKLDAAKVKDRDLRVAIRVSKMDLTKVLERRKLFAEVVGNHNMPAPTAVESPLDKYVLFNQHVLGTHPDHVYNYLNAAHAAEAKGV